MASRVVGSAMVRVAGTAIVSRGCDAVDTRIDEGIDSFVALAAVGNLIGNQLAILFPHGSMLTIGPRGLVLRAAESARAAGFADAEAAAVGVHEAAERCEMHQFSGA